ncbi:UxaA family hydrolase [Paenactinomyces guangxiensis]|uniref:Altronate dehydratase n=1 Tax=Paenactinomyces guangxiensis TaxID=1490290 RepID=A0A7W2A8W0_9BACL|nr:altronate dehydratase family protein [Paenactinomyces guangxiensis]MBA4494582.1 altronate dehydratase [Paenactinomyces guangxiensis]MBH8591655.1 altronate dehydratase [Paenactinomyces guangxiensis]
MTQPYLQIHPQDNVIVALQEFHDGDIISLENTKITVRETVPRGHKIAIKELPAGADVIKFAYSIGKAVKPIRPGEWVHTHNLTSGLKGLLEYQYEPNPVELAAATEERTFQGYVRKNGEAGVRNEIWILNTVGCINKTCETLARLANQQFKGRNFDGVYHFAHPFGCSQLGDDLVNTQLLLSSLANHPNAAGVLIVGLGCENNNVPEFKKVLGDFDPNRVKFMVSQEEEDELAEGMRLLEELVAYAETFEREPVPLSKLKIGLKCGGSDGFSGITANPLVGAFSDMLISFGGTTILTEVPEMFGAETILMNRGINEEVFRKTVRLINDFKEYFIRHGQEVYENPSPGNKQGGITTLEEKSLGCTQKGGTSPVVDVLPYGHRVSSAGLNLVQAPGNDLVSVSALAAAGAHIVLFTTGRGTPFGGPVPTVKISTNTPLYEKKRNWIDFNAGQLLEEKEMDQLKEEFFEYIVRVASGEILTNNEKNGFREIAIFKDGVIL